jgi:hypothetical protein
VSVVPRDPRHHGNIDGICQRDPKVKWEVYSELNGGEAHETKVAIGVEARGVGVGELLDYISALEPRAEGEQTEDHCDSREEERPHENEGVCKRGVVEGGITANTLNDVGTVTLNNNV